MTYYNPDGMNPKDREAFMAWHATKKESNDVFNFIIIIIIIIIITLYLKCKNIKATPHNKREGLQ